MMCKSIEYNTLWKTSVARITASLGRQKRGSHSSVTSELILPFDDIRPFHLPRSTLPLQTQHTPAEQGGDASAVCQCLCIFSRCMWLSVLALGQWCLVCPLPRVPPPPLGRRDARMEETGRLRPRETARRTNSTSPSCSDHPRHGEGNTDGSKAHSELPSHAHN